MVSGGGSAGHGGQIVVSEMVARLVGQTLGPGISLEDLGPHRLKAAEAGCGGILAAFAAA